MRPTGPQQDNCTASRTKRGHRPHRAAAKGVAGGQQPVLASDPGLRAVLAHAPPPPRTPLPGLLPQAGIMNEPVGSRVPDLKASAFGFHPQKLLFLISTAHQRERLMWPWDSLPLAAQPPVFMRWTGPWAVGGPCLGWAPSKRVACVTPPAARPLPPPALGGWWQPCFTIAEREGHRACPATPWGPASPLPHSHQGRGQLSLNGRNPSFKGK